MVHGKLSDPAIQKEYLARVSETAHYYKKNSFAKDVTIVGEDEFSLPGPNPIVVFVGPISAFKNPTVLGLPLKVTSEKEIQIGETVFKDPRIGFFLANQGRTRQFYGGLSYEGYQGIFKVPTGNNALTMTLNGKTDSTGDYKNGKLVIKPSPFAEKYPSKVEVEDLEVPEGAISLQPLSDDEPKNGTSETKDLDWLKDKVKDNKVFFFGEGHWCQGIHNMSHRIILELAKNYRLGAVFLELPYSHSGYYNYYISLKDDKDAENFFQKELDFLVSDTSAESLLRMLRNWNVNNPAGKITIGCNDMEWGAFQTISRVLVPYFKKLDPKFSIDEFIGDLSTEQLKALIKKLNTNLAVATKKNFIGNWPFLTPAYIGNVIRNLNDTFACSLAGDKWMAVRQKAFIRNTTDPKYNGAAFDSPLVFIHGGGWHAKKNLIGGKNGMPDATFLNNHFEKTKGKVYSLTIDYLALNFKPVSDFSFKTHFGSADTYNELVERFQRSLSRGGANVDDYYFCWDTPSLFYHLVIKMAYQQGFNALRFGAINWDSLKKNHGDSFQRDLENFKSYDDYLLVLKSPIEKTRLLPKPH
jgi:hypothetical protein